MKLKKNMIVTLQGNDSKDTVIVLEVTKKDIKKGINAAKPGLYGFRGLWYKGNGTKHHSYGKIYDLSYYDDSEIEIVRNHIYGLSKKDLQNLLTVRLWRGA